SGGERQRVAIARALALQPKVLLLDEPLASLDMARRREVMPWLERLRDELRTPMLYVTHSADEVARLADQLVVLEQGRIKASGPVTELLHQVEHPALGFAETATLLLGEVDQLDPAWHLARVAFAGGAVWVRDTGLALGRPVRLRILARDVSLASAEPQHSSIQNQLPCVIEAIVPDSHASQRLVRLRCGNTLLQARVTARAIDALGLRASSSVWAQVKSVALVE
ncbi:MAG: molybdenum ABC transporter ATP-binding protein, partial [Burkholderiaceae bacterium]